MSTSALTITASGDASDPARFAAEELQRYLERMTGANVPRRTAPGHANALVIGAPVATAAVEVAAGDGFAIAPGAGGAVIHGGSARALLHGVYALLEQLGCRWSLQGRRHETVPRLAALPPIQARQVAPRFAVRGYSADIMTWHYGDAAQLAEHLAADYEFVDWMGKSAANAFLFIRHPFDSQLTIPELLPDFARRGIDAEYGGHVIPLLLPREEFSRHPDFFPQSAAGARSEFGNLCTANAAALRMATDHAVHSVREHPELRVLHIWGADLWDGGWCHCGACRSVTVQDQSLRLCNAVANALAEQGMARPVCHLAYHDTLAPDVHERPAANVFVEYAPRERCYGHALNDPGCRTNRRYRGALERYAELFDGRVRIFEYYADAILFCGCAVPLGNVIAEDLDYYHALGIREITNLQFGAFSVWAYALNFLVYAAATRWGGCDVGACGRSAAEAFGPEAAAVATALAEVEAVMRTVVTYGDIRRPPKQPERVRELQPRLDYAIDRLAAVAEGLAPVARDSAVAALRALLHYNRAVLAGVRQELDGRHDEAPRYEEALATMRSIDRRFTGLWGVVDLPLIHAYHSAGLFAS